MRIGARLLDSLLGGPLLTLGNWLLHHDMLRRPLLRITDDWLHAWLDKNERDSAAWGRIERERILVVLAVLHTVDRVIQRRILAPRLSRLVSELWLRALFLDPAEQSAGQRFRQQFGCAPPWFITISPGHACNLHCTGCYASSELSEGTTAAKLPWAVFERIISEARELWGIPLVVLSGGEPLAYHSEGKDVLDAVEKHSDCMFLMFTNGTLIDQQTAARLARLGNLTPAISVEGLHQRTDERRGAGVFHRVLQAMAYLRQAGVPFGISATVTRFNGQEILSDEFLDFFFGAQGAFYGFLFHYMPIGHSAALNLVPTPAQRVQFWQRTWEVIAKKHIFLFDFWNSGPLVEGCVSAGREAGYIYIDWNGKVMPCVFAPYAAANIQEVYAQGGTLNDVWKAPFFQAIRQWQRDYGYGRNEPSKEGNWLRPCPIRDHYHMFRELLARYRPEPEDEAARKALSDWEYYKGMVAYGMDVAEFSQEIWEKEYLGQKE